MNPPTRALAPARPTVVAVVLRNLMHCALFVVATVMLATIGPG